MVLDAFERDLIAQGFTAFRRRRPYYVNLSKGNALPDSNGSIDPRVGVHPKIVVDSFFTSFDGRSCLHGIVVEFETYYSLDVPLKNLVKNGMDCRGMYFMLRDHDGEYPELAQYNNLMVGKLIGIRDDKAHMEDLRAPELQDLDTKVLCPEPSRRNLNLYVQSIHPNLSRTILGQLRHKISISFIVRSARGNFWRD